MKLKVDIDNVIRDMGSRMIKIYNNRFGTSYTKEDIIDYDVDIAFPLLKNEGIDAKNFFFKFHSFDVFHNAKVMEGALEGLELARSIGHEIILVSYQPTSKNKEDTLAWLEKNNIPFDALVFTNKEDKNIIPADYIIDDCPKFLDNDSAKTVCIDWKYNRGRNYDYRVKSILEFIELIKNDH